MTYEMRPFIDRKTEFIRGNPFPTLHLKIMEPPQDQDSGCKLMDGFGIFIQLCLATTAFSTLIFKRQREQPQRPIRIWYVLHTGLS